MNKKITSIILGLTMIGGAPLAQAINVHAAANTSCNTTTALCNSALSQPDCLKNVLNQTIDLQNCKVVTCNGKIAVIPNTSATTDCSNAQTTCAATKKATSVKKAKVKKAATAKKTSTSNTSTKTTTSTAQKATSGQTSATISSEAAEVIRLVNVERSKNGLAPLTANTELSKMATVKAQDMINKNYFSHTSPTYGSPFDMMTKFGIKYTAAGENIAYGQKTAAEVMNGWMNSPGHRANILSSNYTQIGVGLAKKADGTIYWVQEFINPGK